MVAREDNRYFTFFLRLHWMKQTVNYCVFHPMKQNLGKKGAILMVPFFPWSLSVHQNVPFRAPKLQFYPREAHRLLQLIMKGAYL